MLDGKVRDLNVVTQVKIVNSFYDEALQHSLFKVSWDQLCAAY